MVHVNLGKVWRIRSSDHCGNCLRQRGIINRANELASRDAELKEPDETECASRHEESGFSSGFSGVF
jgi:hypothetical protein